MSQELSKFVDNVMTRDNLSSYQASETAKQAGYKIDPSYINRIRKGLHTNPSVPKQKALAKGLNVSEDEIFNIVRTGSVEITNEIINAQLSFLDKNFEKLNEADQKKIKYLIDILDREFRTLLKRKK